MAKFCYFISIIHHGREVEKGVVRIGVGWYRESSSWVLNDHEILINWTENL